MTPRVGRALLIAALVLGVSGGMGTARADGSGDAAKPASTKPVSMRPAPGGAAATKAAGVKADRAKPTATTQAETPQGAKAKAPARTTAIVATTRVLVVRPDKARAALVKRLEVLGGYPTFLGEDRLTLKVAPENVGALLAAAAAQGLVLDKKLERKDLTETIAQLEARLRSKVTVLDKLQTFFSESGLSATLDVERRMRTLVGEVEQVKGQLRVSRERVRWAVVKISFRFEKRERRSDTRSPFGWVNTVDIERFLGGF